MTLALYLVVLFKQNNGWLTVGCLTPSGKYVIHIQDENIWKAYRNEGGTEHTEMREEQNIQKWGRNRTYRNEGGTELPGQLLTATENCLTGTS
jgi:hypothetical protein